MDWLQHRETEQKLLQIYDQQQQRAHQVAQRGSAGSNISYGSDSSPKDHQMALKSSDSQITSTLHAGKVRQMFGERRQAVVKGVDKSNPLDPLESKQRKNWKTPKGKILVMGKQKNDSTLVDINDNTEKLYSGLKKNDSMDGVEKKLKYPAKISSKKLPRSDFDSLNSNGTNKKSLKSIGAKKTKPLNENENENSISNKTVTRKIKNDNVKSKIDNENPKVEDEDKINVEIETDLSSKLEESYPRAESATSESSTNYINGNSDSIDDNMASRSRLSSSGSQKLQLSATSQTKANEVSTKSCKTCGRNFAVDRLKKHEEICSKVNTKKRKTFDATVHRVRGTEMESYVKPVHKKGSVNKRGKKPEVVAKPEAKSNWRRKHEDFIKTIRAAKEMQAHLDAGGKLSDLPPPPSSDTSDYIKCPHCGRKFNQAAADRHIPKCQHMLHNKPKFK